MSKWEPDVLGDGYEQLTIPLGSDPDGEGDVVATLVRYQPKSAAASAGRAVLYVHGFTDYFFHRHVAEHFAAQGYAFYALDLRKCGRSRREGQTPHYVSELALYDTDLDSAVEIIRDETAGELLVTAHSTGGLIVPLWLDRRRRTGRPVPGLSGVVLNSPWFDLQGPSYVRNVGTAAIEAAGRVRPMSTVPLGVSVAYGESLHAESNGEWNYDLNWKPLTGFPVTFGWLRAIRHGHAKLHRGLDIGAPSLILRSQKTYFSSKYSSRVDGADAVLDVDQIARWAGCLGNRTTIVPIDGARHDVFLSAPAPRAAAFEELDLWLDWLHAQQGTSASS
ncbi:MAG: alpha/beta hydrolase [Rhodococcus sp.]|nr:alpha/beta hydrolase [Rhodococcus sp. (in: high G+C Gram-positive bacteria)]